MATDVNEELEVAEVVEESAVDLVELLRQRKKQNAGSFNDLALWTANGDRIDPAEAEAILDAAKKSLDDLANAVRTIQKRRDLFRQRAEIDAAVEELPALRQQLEDSLALFKAAEQEHFARCRPPQIRINEINQMNINGGDMDRQIRALATEAQVTRLRSNGATLRHLNSEMDRVSRMSSGAETDRDNALFKGDKARAAQIQGAIDRREAAVAEVQKQLNQAVAEMHEIDRAIMSGE